MTGGSIREEDLHAYVDGELPPGRVAEVEALVAADPSVAESVRNIRTQNARLHAAFDPLLLESPPVRLSNVRRTPSRWGRAAAAIAWVTLGGVVGWSMRDAGTEPRHVVLPRQAAVAHAAFTPEVRHPVEVTAAEEAHLVAWLSKRLGAKVKPPRLAPFGYELLGGRLLPESGRPGAQFMYQDAGGKRLTLYVSTDVDNRDSAFRYATENGVHVFYWIDQHLGYALSGDLAKPDLLRIARSVYEQLNP